MRQRGILGLGLCVLLVSTDASAKIIDLYVQAQGGVGYGKGIKGTHKDKSFFAQAKGTTYGVLGGIELLGIDTWVEINEYRDGNVVLGRWTALMAGIDFDIPLLSSLSAQLGAAIGIGAGTGQQLTPPFDFKKISDRGLLAQFSFGVDYNLNRMIALGVFFPFTYSYLSKDESGSNVDLYSSFGQSALVRLRVHLGF